MPDQQPIDQSTPERHEADDRQMTMLAALAVISAVAALFTIAVAAHWLLMS